MLNKLKKDCMDFIPLKDGTFTGDYKYCDLSLKCRQLGMKSDWYRYFNHETKIYELDYFCTGVYAKKIDDDEVS